MVLRINVRFVAIDLPTDLTHIKFDLPENATVENVMDACLTLPRIELDRVEFLNSTVLLNGYVSQLSTPLSEGDTLFVLRATEGG